MHIEAQLEKPVARSENILNRQATVQETLWRMPLKSSWVVMCSLLVLENDFGLIALTLYLEVLIATEPTDSLFNPANCSILIFPIL